MIQKKILDFLRNDMGVDTDNISCDQGIFTSNLLNSIEVIEMIVFLEKEFSIKIPSFDVSLEMLDTVNLITKYVENCINNRDAVK